MDVIAMQSLLADLSREIGVVERPRKPHGFWTPYAWAVRALVTMKGMSVSDAAKVVLRNAGLQVTAQDVACVRVVYYKIRDMQWPEGMYDALMGRLEEVGRGSAEVPTVVLPTEDVPAQEETVTEPEDWEEDVTDEECPLPDDLRAELEAEVATGFVQPFTPDVNTETVDPGVDPDADPDYQP